jgi:hypothetical protein
VLKLNQIIAHYHPIKSIGGLIANHIMAVDAAKLLHPVEPIGLPILGFRGTEADARHMLVKPFSGKVVRLFFVFV